MIVIIYYTLYTVYKIVTYQYHEIQCVFLNDPINKTYTYIYIFFGKNKIMVFFFNLLMVLKFIWKYI